VEPLQVRKQVALLAGATGLVGGEILRLLVQDPEIGEVRVPVRRPLPESMKGPKVRELQIDFNDLSAHPEWFKVDLVFSALGTTFAKARSRKAFRRVDFDYPLAIARLARAQGARHFLFVSALAADSRSFVFYTRVKGELEDAIRSLGYPSVAIARPSQLLGDRKEHRFGEKLAKKFSMLLPSPWAGVQAWQVAAGLVKAAHDETPGVRVLENRELRRIVSE
jgi:uncharacterized protein YbjT (DUF2867 family)